MVIKIIYILGVVLLVNSAEAQCPWDLHNSELQSSCICAYNLGQQLSVQCDMVDFSQLLKALEKFGRSMHLELLYINNSTIKQITAGTFKNLRLSNLQLSGCGIKSIQSGAFDGLHPTLKNLYLQDNELEEIPVDSLRGMKNLTSLDLSRNKITRISDSAFSTLGNLATLKLADNDVTLMRYAFRGLEASLKNLNLKGTKQKKIPEAIRGLRTLAFLDLAQNGLRELSGSKAFEGLRSLTALNLERNVIQTVKAESFEGVKETLSSLSLLNNLLTEFPTEALSILEELRVLDIGFNLLTELPKDAFLGNPGLTLLALDGNPLSTVPGVSVAHLNATLRGLSLGGRFLHCDCRLRWIAQWVRRGDLQVTSRERNPQYCGSPPKFTEKNFYNIDPDELTCSNERPGVALPVEEDSVGEDDIPSGIGIGVGYIEPTTTTTTTTTTSEATTTPTTSTTPPTTEKTTTVTIATTREYIPPSTTSATTTTTVKPKITTRRGSAVISRGSTPWPPIHNRPPLVLGHPPRIPQDVIVRSAHRQDNSVVIQWDSETANILGFRVVYRLFGDKSFKQGPPLEASEREFKIKNVPSQECIVVCVISLEEINVTPETVPYAQCREVRTVTSPTNNMDKITIAASAAICGTVVIAVIVFVAASRRRTRKLHTLDGSSKLGLPMGGLPVACCPSSPAPMSSLAQLNAFTSHKDWDQVSVYSNRSLSRPRMYHVDRQGVTAEDVRSHFSSKPTKTRSIADGQSQHSFSNSSARYLNGLNGFSSCLVSSRPELRQSRQSLAVSDRMSRSSYPAGGNSHHHHQHQHSNGQRRRSRGNRDAVDQNRGLGVGMAGRPASRYSTAGSTHTLNYCGDTSDNWTDHDMDIYMTRNPTTRGGLVPL